MRKLLAAALIGTMAMIAAPASAGIVNVSMQGVIVENAAGGCQTFEADDGATYLLSTLGGFQPGDRVHVTGTYNDLNAGVCFRVAGYVINVTSIKPAFAGVGTLIKVGEKARIQTDDGRNFVVQNSGAYRSGARVYVQGQVTPGRTISTITSNVIGAPVSEFGRITSLTPGGLRLAGESGAVYALDRPGSINGVFEGDYIFVEGIRGKPVGGVTPVTSVTARPAFKASGSVVAGAGGNEFLPDTLIFPDRYTADALTGFPVGSKVYLRGRSTDDYDYGEARGSRYVRLSLAESSYAAVGVIDTTAGTVINGSDGTLIQLEYAGNPVLNPNGSLVYVAGTIAAQGLGTVTLSHNEVRIGIASEGTLLNGFGCTPIIRFDNGGYIFPKNNGGLPVGSHVRVIGGFTFDAPCNDEYGLVDNTIELTGGCANCE
jgi:hypothetical protein